MNWALAVTKPNSEPSVERGLILRGLTYHAFKYQTKIIRLRKVVTVLRPLFPRYIFLPFDTAWAATHIDNVQGLVTFGGELAAVSHVLVEGLVSSGTNDIIPIKDAPTATRPNYRAGDRVVAIVGTLVGHCGRVIRALASGRIRCEFDLNAKHIIADIPPLELCLVQRAVAKRRKRRYRRKHEEATAA